MAEDQYSDPESLPDPSEVDVIADLDLYNEIVGQYAQTTTRPISGARSFGSTENSVPWLAPTHLMPCR